MKRTAKSTSWLLAFGLLVASAGVAQARSESTLIPGLNDAGYLPYRHSVVVKTQDALKEAGLYAGPANGVLDEATMKALGQFQKQHGLEVSGVPTPRTRTELFGAQVASAATSPSQP